MPNMMELKKIGQENTSFNIEELLSLTHQPQLDQIEVGAITFDEEQALLRTSEIKLDCFYS